MNKYPKYKISKFDWLGEVPDHWVITKNRYGFIKSNNGSNQTESTPVLSLTTKGVKVKENLNFGKSSESYIGHQLVEVGDIVFTPRDFDQTPILSDVSKYSGCISNLYIVDKTKNNVLNYFVNYYWYGLKYSVNYFKNFSHGMRYSFNRFQFDEIPLLVPSLSEQHKIVQFLDEKTELIDKLISTKERKIILLKEQRISLINQVVTKGLNPNVKMKDSGLVWIEEIPEGWVVGKLKHNSELKISSVDKHIYEDEIQVIVCNYTDVYYNEIITKNLELRRGSCTIEEFTKYKLEKGDVIITKDSESPNDIGVPSIVLEDLDNVVCGYHLSIIKPNTDKIIGSFLFRQLQTTRVRSYYEICSNGITRFGLGKSSVLETPLIIPPIKEQEDIVKYIDTKTKEIDDLVSLEKKKIDLLKEYRQSLISEVVTGKIKVTTNE